MANKKKRRISLLDAVLALLVIVLIFAVVGILFSVLDPEAGERIRTALSSRVSILVDTVTGGAEETGTSVVQRAQEGYEGRVKPFFRFLVSPYSGRVEGVRKERARSAREKIAEACLECHEKVFERTASDHIYFDHEVHKDEELCQDCHGEDLAIVEQGDEDHTEAPPSPRQDTCINCHEKVASERAPTDCKGCHPPGSILTKEVYSDERINEFVVDKIQVRVPFGFEYGRSTACEAHHDNRSFCPECHAVRQRAGWTTTHQSNWLTTHRLRIEASEFQPKDCWECHSANWCSTACHQGGLLRLPLPPTGRPNLQN